MRKGLLWIALTSLLASGCAHSPQAPNDAHPNGAGISEASSEGCEPNGVLDGDDRNASVEEAGGDGPVEGSRFSWCVGRMEIGADDAFEVVGSIHDRLVLGVLLRRAPLRALLRAASLDSLSL